MKGKDLILVCLIVLTAISGTLCWLSTIEMSYWEVADVEMVPEKVKVPEKPLGSVWLHVWNPPFVEGKYSRKLNTTFYTTMRLKLNMSALVEEAKTVYPEAGFFALIVEPVVNAISGNILDAELSIETERTVIYKVEVEQRDWNESDGAWLPHFVAPENVTSFFVELHAHRNVHDPAYEDNTCTIRVAFEVEIECWSEKRHDITVEKPRLRWIKVRKHVFGDDPTPTVWVNPPEHVYSNGIVTTILFLATAIQFVLLIYCIFVHGYDRRQKNE